MRLRGEVRARRDACTGYASVGSLMAHLTLPGVPTFSNSLWAMLSSGFHHGLPEARPLVVPTVHILSLFWMLWYFRTISSGKSVPPSSVISCF